MTEMVFTYIYIYICNKCNLNSKRKTKNSCFPLRRPRRGLDLNNDGKIDAKDLELAKAKAVGFFGTALPSASGLAAGIMIGLKI